MDFKSLIRGIELALSEKAIEYHKSTFKKEAIDFKIFLKAEYGMGKTYKVFPLNERVDSYVEEGTPELVISGHFYPKNIEDRHFPPKIIIDLKLHYGNFDLESSQNEVVVPLPAQVQTYFIKQDEKYFSEIYFIIVNNYK